MKPRNCNRVGVGSSGGGAGAGAGAEYFQMYEKARNSRLSDNFFWPQTEYCCNQFYKFLFMVTLRRMWQLFLDLKVCTVSCNCLRYSSAVRCP